MGIELTRRGGFFRRGWILWMLIVVALLGVAGCDFDSAAVPPEQEADIKALVEDYFVQDANIPEYEVTIEEVWEGWARVSVEALAIETTDEKLIFYLQNQATAESPVPAVPAPGPAESAQPLGWAIVAGPQAQFTEAELDAAQVPAEIRS